jgi:hypothetical protein
MTCRAAIPNVLMRSVPLVCFAAALAWATASVMCPEQWRDTPVQLLPVTVGATLRVVRFSNRARGGFQQPDRLAQRRRRNQMLRCACKARPLDHGDKAFSSANSDPRIVYKFLQSL